MTRQNLFFVLAGVELGLIVATHLPLRAQGERKSPVQRKDVVQPEIAPTTRSASASSGSIQDALLRNYDFQFDQPTPLSEVSRRLSRELGAPVVLDLAALERLDLKPADTVTLGLQGVRLKTGLRLLLDQAGLTYRVVPEDNLLILTDKTGSEDPIERVLSELHELHRDVHDVQDTLDEIREMAGDQGEGSRVRKPTIIEELPEGQAPAAEEPHRDRPALRPDSNTKLPRSSTVRPRTSL